jgi:hypothetical protein
MVDISAEEKQWRAESDARTLVEAQEIRKDKDRYKRAKTKLKEQVNSTLTAAAEENVKVRMRNLGKKK